MDRMLVVGGRLSWMLTMKVTAVSMIVVAMIVRAGVERYSIQNAEKLMVTIRINGM